MVGSLQDDGSMHNRVACTYNELLHHRTIMTSTNTCNIYFFSNSVAYIESYLNETRHS